MKAFFDADCLAYEDSYEWWKLFTEESTDFSSIGSTVDLHATSGACYNVEDIGGYGKDITYKCRIYFGVAFIRKSEKLKNLF